MSHPRKRRTLRGGGIPFSSMVALILLCLSLGKVATADAPPQSGAVCTGTAVGGAVHEIRLDDTGIASFKALNPRKPFWLAKDDKDAQDDEAYRRELGQSTLYLRNMTNRLLGVEFKLSLPSPKSIQETYDSLGQRLEAGAGKALNLTNDYAQASTSLTNCGSVDDLKETLTKDDLEKLRSCRDGLSPFPLPGLDKVSQRLYDSLRQSLEQLISTLDAMNAIQPDNIWDKDKTTGKQMDLKACKLDRDSQRLSCSNHFVVVGGTLGCVPGSILTALEVGTATFSVDFADSADIPSNSTGYLQTAFKIQEPLDSTKWNVAGQVGGNWEPAKANNSKNLFSETTPFQGERLQHLVGAGNFKLDQRLGNRAAATATIGFKKGDLGEKNTTLQATVPEYTLKLFGINGTQLLFGKYTQAAPSDGIAISAKGEGVELRSPAFRSSYEDNRLLQHLSLGYIVKRESAAGTATPQNRDSRLFLAQLRGYPLHGRSAKEAQQPEELDQALSTVSVVTLYGSERSAPLEVPLIVPEDKSCPQPSPADPAATTRQVCYAYHYWTVGFEAPFSHLFLQGSRSLYGSIAAYWSGRKLDRGAAAVTGDRVRDGRGFAGLLKETLAIPEETLGAPRFTKGVKRTYGMQIGYGSGGRTQDRTDRGYIGETQSFAPDQIFLSSLAGNIGTERGGPNANEKLVLVAPGLSNKTLVSGIVTWNQSPLFALGRSIFEIGEEPTSNTTTLKVHYYRFNQPVFRGHEAGLEGDLEFAVGLPKGVTTTLDVAYFKPGSGLQPAFPKDAWLVSLTVKASI